MIFIPATFTWLAAYRTKRSKKTSDPESVQWLIKNVAHRIASSSLTPEKPRHRAILLKQQK